MGEETIVNQYLNFDGFGNIDKKISNYYSIAKEKDTILINETCKLNLYLDAPFFNEGNMEVVIGNYNNLFEVKDSTSLDTIRVNGWHASIEKKFITEGEKILRGKILNIKKDTYEIREMYFEGIFTVLKN